MLDMTSVEIEYCVPCGHLERAQNLQGELLSTFGQDVESVALVTEDGGTFRVLVDEELIFDKEEDEFDVDGIVDTVRGRL